MKEKKLTTSNIGQNTNEFKWIQAPNTDMYILFLSLSLTLLYWCLAVLFCFENLCATFIRLGCDMFHTIRNICSHLSHFFFLLNSRCFALLIVNFRYPTRWLGQFSRKLVFFCIEIRNINRMFMKTCRQSNQWIIWALGFFTCWIHLHEKKKWDIVIQCYNESDHQNDRTITATMLQ